MKADISFLPADDPDMDRPLVSGRDFEDGTRTAVRTLSSKFNTEVVFAGDQACTNGNKVILPSQAPDVMLTKRQAHVGRGFANHEALHNLLTDFQGSIPFRVRWAAEGKQFTMHMSQAIEDVRIEHGGCQLYPGMAKSVDKTAEYVCRRFVEKTFVENPDIASDAWAVLPLAVTWAGRLRIGYPSPVIRAAFDALSEDVRKRADKIVDVVMQIPHGVTGVGQVDRKLAYEGCKQGLELSERVAAEMAKELPEQEEEEGPEESEAGNDGTPRPNRGGAPSRKGGKGKGKRAHGSSDQDGDDGSGQAGGADGAGGAGSESGSESGAGSGAGDQDGSGGGSQASGSPTHESEDNSTQQTERATNGGGHGAVAAPAGDANTSREARSVDPNLDHAVVDLMTDGNDGSNAYRPFTRSEDTWETKRNPGRMTSAIEHYGASSYAQHKSRISSSLATMRRKLERALIAKENRVYTSSRSGRLDVRKRGVGILTGADLIYKKREEGDDINAAVQILVDLSGSMDGDKVIVATQACIGIAEALATTTVPLEVIGHHTTNLRDSSLRDELSRQISDYQINEDGTIMVDDKGVVVPKEPSKFDRYEAVKLYEFKEFEQPLSQARSTLGIMHMMTAGANADADAIMYAAQRLLARDEDRKIMLVMADGFPAWNSAGGKTANYRRTRDAVAWCESKGISLVGVGIQSDAVSKFYPRHVVIQSVEDLGKTVLDQVARLILGERFRVDNKDLLSTDRNRARAMAR